MQKLNECAEPPREINQITSRILYCALQIHSNFGPGMLESVYESILARDLIRMGLHVERQKSVTFEYEGLLFERACRVDLIVDRTVVVEVKSVPALTPTDEKQLLTYLRLLKLPVGLLINFGAARLSDGIKRKVNGYDWNGAPPRPPGKTP